MPRRHPLTALALAATVSLAGVGLAGCGTSAEGTAPGTLRIAGPFEIHSLDPTADGEIFTRLQVTETLVTADVEGRIVPGLATGWETSADQRTWTFDLVDGARFHDGTRLDGATAASSLTKAAAQEASPLATVPVREIRGTDDKVTIRLSTPHTTLPAVLTHYSTQVLAPASYDSTGRVTDVIGTGPYEVDRVELPASIETRSSDNWRGEAPDVERVTFQAVGRAESRALMATSGQADVVFGLEPAGRQQVESSGEARMESALQPRTLLLKVNAAHPILGDPDVRKALSLALDRESMAEAVLREPGLAATQLMPPSLSDWHAEVDPLVHDEDAAKALLAGAGWRPGRDGTLRKDGKPLQLNLLTYPDRPELPALATAIQGALATIGVDVKVDVTNSSAIPAGQADGSLELALIAKHFALVSDPLVDIAAVFDEDGDDWGAMNWRDPAMQEAINGLLEGATGNTAAAHRTTISRVAQEQLPLIPVAWYRMNAAVNDRVEGFVMDPLETTWRLTDITWAS